MGVLTGFRSDVIEVTYVDIEERTSNAATGKSSVIGEGIAAYTLIDDDGEHHMIHTKMSHVPSTKYRLMHHNS